MPKKHKPLVEQLPDLVKKLQNVAGKLAYAEMVYGHTLFDPGPVVRLVEAAKLITQAIGMVSESQKELSLQRPEEEGE